LLIVLWTVALLALLGAHITAASREAASLSRLLYGAAEAEALVDGLISEAIFRLLDPSARGWKPDGQTRSVRLGGGIGEVAVLDHAGRVNPSLANPPLLAALLRHEGMEKARADQLAAAIKDWVTAGDLPSAGGAKIPQYRAAGLPYGPPAEPFRSVEELGLVLGMTPDVVARLEQHLSVWTRGRINLDLADPVVLQAVQEAGSNFVGPRQRGQQGEAEAPVVEIVARVTLREAQAGRRVVVRLNPAEADTAQPWHILAWH
jgi:general secretion pathway protein K